jgi:hypothetical protein
MDTIFSEYFGERNGGARPEDGQIDFYSERDAMRTVSFAGGFSKAFAFRAQYATRDVRPDFISESAAHVEFSS